MKNLNIVEFNGDSERLAQLLTEEKYVLVWGADTDHAAQWIVGVVHGREPGTVYRVEAFGNRAEALASYHNLSAWVRDVNTSTLEA